MTQYLGLRPYYFQGLLSRETKEEFQLNDVALVTKRRLVDKTFNKKRH